MSKGIVFFSVHAYDMKAMNLLAKVLAEEPSFDEGGGITKANLITPTAQNAAKVEKDIRVIAGNHVDEDAELRSNIEEMIRAYDPCISCSVHLVRLR